jgi:hypothetical protein
MPDIKKTNINLLLPITLSSINPNRIRAKRLRIRWAGEPCRKIDVKKRQGWLQES